MPCDTCAPDPLGCRHSSIDTSPSGSAVNVTTCTIHCEGATIEATDPEQVYVVVNQNAADLTVEMAYAGPIGHLRPNVIRCHFAHTAESSAIIEARKVAGGIRADAEWMARS